MQAFDGAREHSWILLRPGQDERSLYACDHVFSHRASGLRIEAITRQGSGQRLGPGSEISSDFCGESIARVIERERANQADAPA